MKNNYLEELWTVREQMAARHGYDLHRLVEYLREAQAKHGDRMIAPPKARRGAKRALRTAKHSKARH